MVYCSGRERDQVEMPSHCIHSCSLRLSQTLKLTASGNMAKLLLYPFGFKLAGIQDRQRLYDWNDVMVHSLLEHRYISGSAAPLLYV